ncbi:hypothetical protein QOZ80_8AG0637790 [Eleusine coracana subsp. coracana]|nr:hypothetical protein QOZ80_8AG0637790 [Eleusine coracana subsp. coracana]
MGMEMKHHDTNMLGSGFLEFKLYYSETRNLAIGDALSSDYFSAGGHLWRIYCYPRGRSVTDNGEYLSIFLHLISHPKDIKTIFHVFCLGENAEPDFSNEKRSVHVFSSEVSENFGWNQFMKRSILEANYVINGQLTLICGILVMGDNSIPMPSSEIRYDLVHLFNCKEGTDVSFTVKGETIQAHRVVIAARSPVFKVELFGSMADATSSSILLEDIEPATAKAMFWFMYTDELPEDDELGGSSIELMQHLLAASDRYALDRLKLLCARKLWDNISVDIFASTLACAETHNCPELKSKCYDFFAVENNFKKIVFTDGFMWLLLNYPSLAAKLKERVGI